MRIKPSIIVVPLALFVSLGGTATAASLITSRDIKNGTIKTADLAKSTKRALKGQRGPRGLTGPTGPQGPSVVGRVAYVERSFSVAPGDVDIQGVDCPAGMNIVSGGFTLIGGDVFVSKSYGGHEWSVGVDNYDSSLDATATAHAWCAPAGQAIAAKHVSIGAKRSKDIAALRATR